MKRKIDIWRLDEYDAIKTSERLDVLLDGERDSICTYCKQGCKKEHCKKCATFEGV